MGDGGKEGVCLLEKVRIFRRSVLNRISSWYHVRYPIPWVDMKYVVGNGVCRQDSGNLELETRKRGKSRRV